MIFFSRRERKPHRAANYAKCVSHRFIFFAAIFVWIIICHGAFGNLGGASTAINDATVADSERNQLASQYTFTSPSILLTVHDNGVLAAHDVASGVMKWSTNTGGPLVKMHMKKPPSPQSVQSDPFALPFVVQGNRLFTRVPCGDRETCRSLLADTDSEPVKAAGNQPLNFFMNISALMRRQAVAIGRTDIYVTTSVSVVDVDALSGEMVASSRGHLRDEERKGVDQRHPSSSLHPLAPTLHVVRYQVKIHGYSPGQYQWSIHLAQMQLSERLPYRSYKDESKQDAEHPRFFSKLVDSLFRFDDVPASPSARATAAVSPSKALALLSRPTPRATLESPERQFTLVEVNKSHAALWSVAAHQPVCFITTRISRPNTDVPAHEFRPGIRKVQENVSQSDGLDVEYIDGQCISAAYLWLSGSARIARLAIARQPVGSDHNANSTQSNLNHPKPLAKQQSLPLLDKRALTSYDVRQPWQPTLYGDWPVDLLSEDEEGEELQQYYRRCTWWDTPALTYDYIGDDSRPLVEVIVLSTLAWRTIIYVVLNTVCMACSVGCLCAGVLPRERLTRAWAQADRNRQQHLQLSSRPVSHRLVPQDMLANSPERSVSDPREQSLYNPLERLFLHPSGANAPVAGLARSNAPFSPGEETGDAAHLILPPSTVPLHGPPAVAVTEGEGTLTGRQPSFAHADWPADDESPSGVVPSGALESTSESESVELNMGEKWWLRAALHANRSSHHTMDETVSDGGSTMSLPRRTSEGQLFQQHFKVLEKIGSGAEGAVFCVEHRMTHAKYAVKAIHTHEQDEERVVQEAVLHSSFDNANVVRFYFCWIEDVSLTVADHLHLLERGDSLEHFSGSMAEDEVSISSPHGSQQFSAPPVVDTYRMLFIQMEYFARGTLADFLRTRRRVSRWQNLCYVRQIAEGLQYLHNQNVVHRDLKPTNIFVSDGGVLKIGDFGLAKRRDPGNAAGMDLAADVVGGQQEHSVVGGSPLYCSPEQTMGGAVNKPSDVFSLGIIAVELYCCFNTLHERIRVLTEAHHQLVPPELAARYPEEMTLFNEMLQPSADHRPSLKKLIRTVTQLQLSLGDGSSEYSDNNNGTPAPQPRDDTPSPPTGSAVTSEGLSLQSPRSSQGAPPSTQVPLLAEGDESPRSTSSAGVEGASPLEASDALMHYEGDRACQDSPSREAPSTERHRDLHVTNSAGSLVESTNTRSTGVAIKLEARRTPDSFRSKSPRGRGAQSDVWDPYATPAPPVTYDDDPNISSILQHDLISRASVSLD